MSNQTRSIQNLEENFQKQLGFLERSAQAYDKGFEDEDVRMAVAIRVLVHQTKNSHSILGQLGQDTKFFDTSAPLTDGNFLGEMSLVHTGLGGRDGTRFYAPLSESLRMNLIPFKNWWSQLVFRQRNIHRFSRKDLVLMLANKEGGAHVDPKIDSEFYEIKKEAFGVKFYENSSEIERNDPTSTTMRQIAHEVLASLKNNYTQMPEHTEFGMVVCGESVVAGNGIPKIKRYALCPCESGLKYKKCHGKINNDTIFL